MMERRLDKTRLCALLIDATPFEGQQMVAALGIGQDGRKTILGIRQGATENATVVGELLGDLVESRARFHRAAALCSGWRQGADCGGEKACRRVGGDPALPGPQAPQRAGSSDRRTETGVAKKLNAAYAMEDYAAAKQALNTLHRELMDLNPSAARSLGEGMEETLDRASAPRAHATAQDPGQHQRDRVGVLDRGAGLPERETLARRRSARALGGVGTPGGTRNSSAGSRDTNRFRRSSENWKP